MVPGAELTEIPTVLPGTGPTVFAFPRSMVVAEKLVTALQRGAASTRWRDFADLYLMIAAEPFEPEALAPSIAAVAEHRGVPLASLHDVLAGMPARARARWQAWLGRHGLEGRVPRSFEDLLHELDEATLPWIVAAAATGSKSDEAG